MTNAGVGEEQPRLTLQSTLRGDSGQEGGTPGKLVLRRPPEPAALTGDVESSGNFVGIKDGPGLRVVRRLVARWAESRNETAVQWQLVRLRGQTKQQGQSQQSFRPVSFCVQASQDVVPKSNIKM